MKLLFILLSFVLFLSCKSDSKDKRTSLVDKPVDSGDVAKSNILRDESVCKVSISELKNVCPKDIESLSG